MIARGRSLSVYSHSSGRGGTISHVEPGYHESIAGRLHGLLIRLGERLPREHQRLIAEFIDANELGLALEQLADVLCEDELPVRADERQDMLALAQTMSLGERVSRALALCPEP